MPEPPESNPLAAHTDSHIDLVLRMLYDEQARLRSELGELRKKQEKQSQSGGKKDEDQQEGDQDKDQKEQGGDKEGGGEGDDKKEDDDESDKDNKEGDKDKDDEGGDDKKKEKKPPLLQRVRSWVAEHPVATIFIVLGFIVLVIAAIFLWLYLESYETTDDAFIEGHTDPISARISGIVASVYVENTNRVHKGQLLVQLDPRDYQVAKEQADAQLIQAQAAVRAQTPNVPITQVTQSTQLTSAQLNVTSAEANVTATQEKYHAAEADLQQAEANEGNAQREAERYRQLVEKEEVSREIYDQYATEARAQAAVVASRRESAAAAEKAVTQAKASLGQARAQEEAARHNLPRQIAIQHETLAERQADVQTAQAKADQAELNLEYTRIYAQEDGIIGDKQVQVAEQISPGEELFALTQTNDIWITANFKETDVKKMRPGQSVTVNVDALSQEFRGYVEALPGATGAVYSLLPPENATGNYVKVVQRLPVRIRLYPGQPNENRLASGMSVEPKVWLK